MSASEKSKILILEDEEVARYLNEKILTKEGYQTTATYTIENAKQLLLYGIFDLLVLDLKLPDGCGLDFISWVKNRHPNLPILVVSVLRSPDERARGLNIGANDYLIKPFHPDELVHRVNNLLNPPKSREHSIEKDLMMGEICLDRKNRKLLYGNNQIQLTRGESHLLERLWRSVGKAVSRETLQEMVARNKDGHPRTVDVLVSRLRTKLKKHGLNSLQITPIPEIGYQLNLPKDDLVQ